MNCFSYKNIFFSAILVLFCSICIAQNKQPSGDFWNKVSFGGSFGIGFGDETFNGVLSPSAVYHVNDQFALGAGVNLNYSKFRSSKLFAYGPNVMAFYNPIAPVQISAEFEQLRIHESFKINNTTIKDNYWSPALFAGIGYSNRNVTIGFRYDLLYDKNKSIYANPLMPFIRVYF
ncbi:MAG: alpha-ketoglutarate decarboxylase [Cellulophaga sp.]